MLTSETTDLEHFLGTHQRTSTLINALLFAQLPLMITKHAANQKKSLCTAGGSFFNAHVYADQSFDEADGCSVVNAAAGRLSADLITTRKLNSI
jgi:hypothetical protein